MAGIRLRTLMLVAGLALPACNCGGTDPAISSFTATPPNLPIDGGTVTLAWNVSGATSLSIDQGVGPVTPATTGSTTTVVTTGTNFTLSATNSTGTVTQTASVCVASGAVTLAVKTQSDYVCNQPYRATFVLTNGSCEAVTVTGIDITDIPSSGPCTGFSPASYMPSTASVPVNQTVTVLDLTGQPFCCADTACPMPTDCSATNDFTVITSAGTLTADAGYTQELGGCDVICP